MDIVERLRTFEGSDGLGNGDFSVCATAADEIARLRDELTAARKTNSEWLAANGPGGWINDLRDENEALASNLRGKHATTGATYAHLIAERDRLRDENAKLREDRDEWADKWRSVRRELAALKYPCGTGTVRAMHDSDCATQNEPAYPNWPCDCSAAMRKGE